MSKPSIKGNFRMLTFHAPFHVASVRSRCREIRPGGNLTAAHAAAPGIAVLRISIGAAPAILVALKNIIPIATAQLENSEISVPDAQSTVLSLRDLLAFAANLLAAGSAFDGQDVTLFDGGHALHDDVSHVSGIFVGVGERQCQEWREEKNGVEPHFD
jgi:hypothetical protein